LNGYHIHIQGRVQGVGFRPFVYREASKRKLKGWVKNTLDGVHIEICAAHPFDVAAFVEYLVQHSPSQSRIEQVNYFEKEIDSVQTGFQILHTAESGVVNMPLTPDFAICDDCRRELLAAQNRRSGYPFITCTNCGPRFSVITNLPYDRPNTTMDAFVMCDDCRHEYTDPFDRRFHSQTNSCKKCPVSLSLYYSDGRKIDLGQEAMISYVVDKILAQHIIAVKGIGGYLLLADAASTLALEKLRKRKNRPSKPFALMYPDAEMAAGDVAFSAEIEQSWKSAESPIVLCPIKSDIGSSIKPELVAPGLCKLGVMLPYAPLLVLLMEKLHQPIVATSGNISGSPIIYQEAKAFEYFRNIADFILVNDREIVVPQDDSVVQFSAHHQRKIVLRRSRGMAPGLTRSGNNYQLDVPVLSTGAMLKSAFGLYHEGRYYVSQYLGDTSDLESLESYESVVRHMFSVLDFEPSLVITDTHPNYPTTEFGKQLADQYKAKIASVQHHEAHAFAVLGEHELLDENRILCIVWDGTGWGQDGHIWGGEFFLFDKWAMTRTGHWSYFPHIAGDKMSQEPRISALSLLSHMDHLPRHVERKFTAVELRNYLKIAGTSRLKTSSVGRLFDGIASILDISDVNQYEGEAAMKLEAAASHFGDRNWKYEKYYEIPILADGRVSTSQLLSSMIRDMADGVEIPEIAFKFHLSLVRLISNYAGESQVDTLAFSGGVFQNALLVDLLEDRLSDNYHIHFHKDLSPNDECIPFGQMMAYYAATRGNEQYNRTIEVESINQ